MRPVSLHPGAWRYPNSSPDANFNLALLKSFICKLEAAKFDAFFMADHLAVLNIAIASSSVALGTDAAGFDPDAPLPGELPATNASHTSRAGVVKLAEDEKSTGIAHEMERWLREEAADGFTVVFPFLPQGLDDVTQRLVPELQRRGVFRRDCTGSTLREHLGLPRPGNRFFA
ncbi:hypothetical protein BDW62DRAFT_205340 [Aspergillus aurantiobrunneus]